MNSQRQVCFVLAPACRLGQSSLGNPQIGLQTWWLAFHSGQRRNRQVSLRARPIHSQRGLALIEWRPQSGLRRNWLPRREVNLPGTAPRR